MTLEGVKEIPRRDFEGRSVFVTGATGFIGSHLCNTLYDLGTRVVAIAKATSRYDHWRLRAINSVQVNLTDVRELDEITSVTKGAEVIVHLAAETHVPDSVLNPRQTVDVNVAGTLVCLEAARINDVPLFVYAGTDKIYGDSTTIPLHEGLCPRPKSPYDASKIAGEALCLAYYSTYGIKVVLPRFSNVYGPRQDPRKVVANLITSLLSGGRPVIRGTGESVRDYIYITDVVAAYLTLLSDPLIGEPINFGTGIGTRLLDLYELIAKACKLEITPKILGQKTPGEIEKQYLDITKAKSALGWTPDVTLVEGISKTVQWYRSNPDFWNVS